MRHRALSRGLAGFALAALAMVLTTVWAWAVVGKHGLDPEARYVFKATRAVCAQPALPPCAVPPRTEIPMPPAGAGERVHVPDVAAPPTPRLRFAPSRAPPLA